MKPPTAEASRWVGRVLRDKWRIDARIARGGVGTVFAATHRNNGSRAAIKILHPEFSRDADTRSRFLQEGYAANQVSHPGVVRILDDDVTEEGAAFLVMELLEGELLEKRRQRKGGSLPLPEVYEVAEQLLDVLAAAHEKGIVHRDIKPDNLFVTKEGHLKVLDFGFAQMKSGVRRETTATGFLLGTPGFMSPEQAVGDRTKVDAQTDIWAAGATLFTILTGHPVHEAESAAEMLVAAANYPARSIAKVVQGLPPRLVEVVDKALAFDKKARWPSARAMQAALRTVSAVDAMPESTGERTVFEQVEALDDSELLDAQPSWQTGDRTVMAGPDRKIPAAALPSGMIPPSSDDERTLAAPSPFQDSGPDSAEELPPPTDAPVTPQMVPRGATPPSPSTEAIPESQPETTVIMEASRALSQAGRGGEYPSRNAPAISPSGPSGPPAPMSGPSFHQTPQAFASDPRLSRPDARPEAEMMFVPGQARAAAVPSAASRVLVFVAVAVVSMIIVVVTGLLVFAASD